MNDVAEISNPLANAQVTARPSAPAGGVMASVESQRVIAEVHAAMTIARLNPRDPIAATDRILNACTRPALADAAVYQYSRGGSDISGPSIRLAETIAQNWGNIKTSVRELEQANGASVVQTIAWDLETGYQCDKVFQVPHLRYTKRGATRLEDPRDIYENNANQAARRLRACILAVIPGDVTEAAVQQCEVTMRTKADTSPEAMVKMVEAFKTFNVTREQIEKRIQRHLDAIQPAQVVSLKKVYASLRDGMSTAADWFDPVDAPAGEAGTAPASATEAAKAALKKRGKGNAVAQVPEAAIDPADNPEAGTDPSLAFDEVKRQLEAATTGEQLEAARSLIPRVEDAAEQAQLNALATRRFAAISKGE